jgi:1-aminocyclopropane-1-carboxylate deaminase/D-cysteine desulfhydrase-like pyridoxal-dependent ACC family enzyme
MELLTLVAAVVEIVTLQVMYQFKKVVMAAAASSSFAGLHHKLSNKYSKI